MMANIRWKFANHGFPDQRSIETYVIALVVCPLSYDALSGVSVALLDIKGIACIIQITAYLLELYSAAAPHLQFAKLFQTFDDIMISKERFWIVAHKIQPERF